ncbi:MAG: 50S ribosomal protein L9 [Patescibacteria group bacterium]
MKVILLKDVPKLGRRFDIKEVSSGHALNFLIPRGLVAAGTPDALKKYEIEKHKMSAEKKIHEDLLLKNLKEIEQVTLRVSGKANDKGHLFAGLHREEIAAELASQSRVQVDPSFIMLDHPIKEVGEHKITVSGGGKTAVFTLIVEAKK